MSHEIRTPLNSIVGFSGVLVDMLDEKEDIGQYVALIESNSKLLLKLVGDILDISILDSEVEIKHNAVDVNACCQASIDAAGASFDPGVKLIFEPACDELIINSNYSYIVQVLDNLLGNASKFTHVGSVTLAYEVKKEDNQLIFTVTDTGIGIPVEEQERVFERFVKLDNFSQGAGLGLSICRIVAERLGGYLRIDKGYTQGTRVIFCVSTKGWLHLAHGVRACAAGLRYVLYMYMTALDDPTKLIATPGGYFMAPEGEERIGDVSNVLFTNGWIADEDGKVFIYYASSDTRMHVTLPSRWAIFLKTVTAARMMTSLTVHLHSLHFSTVCSADRTTMRQIRIIIKRAKKRKKKRTESTSIFTVKTLHARRERAKSTALSAETARLSV